MSVSVHIAALTIAILLATPAVADEPIPKHDALPAYVSPATLADKLGIPLGPDAEKRDGGVWYPAPTHRRLAAMVSAVEHLSDARATMSWINGYVNGRDVGAAVLEKEIRAKHRAASDAAGQRRAKNKATGRLVSWTAWSAVAGVVFGVVATYATIEKASR